MQVVICGAGEVGRHTAEVLGERGDRITVIDIKAKALRQIEESLDVRTLQGSGCHASVLKEAGIDSSDVYVAATEQDEINLLSAAIAKRMGATRTIARIHHRAFLDSGTLSYAKYLDIDHLICPEHLTAMVIARMLRNPGVTAIERFAEGRVELQHYVVQEESPAVGVKLMDLDLPIGVRLATIQRGERAFMPEGASVLMPGDEVDIIGESRHADRMGKMFRAARPGVLSIVIMGGTSMAVWLSRALNGPGFSIRLFVMDLERAKELAEKLPHVTVIQEDPTNPAIFHEEQLADCDAFVSVSQSDERNILAALQAKGLGSQQAVVVVAKPTYLTLLAHVGVDHPYSPRIEAAKEIFRIVDDAPVQNLATLAYGVAEVYEVDPVRRGSAVGKPLREVKLPKGAFVAAVQRGHDVSVPGPEDSLRDGDVAIFIGPQGIQKKLRDLFVGK